MRAAFDYLRPSTPVEASQMKTAFGNEARFFAGGTDLLLAWRRGKIRFGQCIDLSYLSMLRYLDASGAELRIGALATLARLAERGDASYPAECLREAAHQMGTPPIRTLATVGGNLCNASPAADLSVLLLALDATVSVLGPQGERRLPLDGFFTGPGETVLGGGELLTAIVVPFPALRTEAAFERVGRSTVDIALVNAAVRLGVDPDGTLADARIVLGAVAPVPVRSQRAEAVLLGSRVSMIDQQQVRAAAQLAAADSDPISDLRASAEYRREASAVLVRRGLEASVQRLQGATTWSS